MGGPLSSRALVGIARYKYKAGGYTWLDDAHNGVWECEWLTLQLHVSIHVVLASRHAGSKRRTLLRKLSSGRSWKHSACCCNLLHTAPHFTLACAHQASARGTSA